ncbi:MAG: transglycosylase domain-containing protein [Lentisphaeria bacterium]|nr:transglycosylase domain-containing protein [Lentisphaeria bacterium]
MTSFGSLFRRRSILLLLLFFALLLFCGGGAFLAWHVLPDYAQDPLEILEEAAPARSWYDGKGALVKRERCWQYQWRLPLPLSQISPEAVKVMLAAEDANFYSHDGVDLSAVCRAAYQNVSSGRIVSGASTIPMQLAALAMRMRKIPRRTLSGKLRQALMARKLVRKYSKDRILEEYLNFVPFGGSLYGIGAASVYYFGLPAKELNLAEASLLCGIPQKPGSYRPDKNLPLARIRQKRVLSMLEKRKILAKGEAEKIFRESPLRLRDFSVRSPLAGNEPKLHDMYFREAAKSLERKKIPLPFHVPTALDQEKTLLVLDTLKKFASSAQGVKDGAAVLIHNPTMRVLVLVGTLDAKDPFTGQVNAATAVRSAGSTLKPFLYGEGIYGGLVGPDSVFLDSPVRYKDYEPANYDGKFRGRVSLEEALRLSLNTTAVKMLAILGEKRALERFSSIGLSDHSGKKNGLSLALGSAGYTLLELTNAFTILPNEGVFRKASFFPQGSVPGLKEEETKRIWDANTAIAVSAILRRKEPPFGDLDAAWKTGTSNGNNDAWCLAATPKYTLGVWFGNKEGKASPDLVGLHLAAPCAAGILEALYRNGEYPCWKEELSAFEEAKLCVETGLTGAFACGNLFSGRKIRGIPLKHCTKCAGGKDRPSLKILFPGSGNYFLEKGKKSVKLPLSAEEKGLIWFIDGIMVKKGKAPDCWEFEEGPHSVTVTDPEGKKKARSVFFQVLADF